MQKIMNNSENYSSAKKALPTKFMTLDFIVKVTNIISNILHTYWSLNWQE